MFLDQLGADPNDPRVQRACDHVLRTTQAPNGGFGASGSATASAPPPSYVIHCLNGNLIRALIGFGHLHDPRVQAALEWAAAIIPGDGGVRFYASGTSGPGFACAGNERQPCAWGAVKELLAFARVPVAERTPAVARAAELAAAFLLAVDPADADYPRPAWTNRTSSSWFRAGFPSAYVTDVLQVLEGLVELGYAHDPRLQRALAWLEAGQDADGRWANRYAYNGKTTVDFEHQGAPSRWVTLRACTVLRAAYS